MNRKHIYRGKKETTGEWVEGYYTFYSNEYSESEENPQGVIRDTRGFDERIFFVIPETVCEYTGVIDIEMSKIYVNDIVEYDGSIGIVRFGQYGSFHFGYYIQWLHCLYLRNELYFWASKVAVIGNIFDHPELVTEIEPKSELNREEILFRGKRKDTGEWVEGFYFSMEHDDSRHIHHFIIPLTIPLGADLLSLGTPIEKMRVEVNLETVCQYTGMPDKNDKKIFEGYIVKRELFEGNFIVGQVVRFDIGYCGFYLKHGNSYYPMEKDEHTGNSSCDEVIGNIFDNPELVSEIEPAD